MTDGLVTRFAIVAHKGVEFDADGAETKLFGGAAVGTFRIGRQSSQLADLLLGGCQRHGGG